MIASTVSPSRWHAMLIRAGRLRVVLFATGASILASVLLAYVLGKLFGMPVQDRATYLLIAAFVPAVIAPVVTNLLMRTVQSLEAVRCELARMVTLDSMTQIYNRGYFMERLASEFARARRGAHALSMLMIDADDFKLINDSHGHSVGDGALKAMADAMARLLRPHDVLARYGGEEFAILLPESTLESACQVAERIRSAIATLTLHAPGGESIAITISVGVASIEPSDVDENAVVTRSDTALYEAKRNGRNRWSA